MGYRDWANGSADLKKYHDEEWGVPVFDDKKMFEHLSLECLQCGLSWGLMLKKREVFRACFSGFDFEKVAAYGEEDVERILQTKDMLRSRGKIEAIVNNAKRFLEIREEFGSFCNYMRSFSGENPILYEGHEKEGARIPVSNGLSARLSADLKKRGFKYVGAITIYSHLQACGVINDHDENCPCYARLVAAYPHRRAALDEEIY